MLELYLEPVSIERGHRVDGSVCIANRSAGRLSLIRLAFRPPDGVRLWRGKTRVTVQRMKPGQVVKLPLVIEGIVCGEHGLQQLNLIYRDTEGRPQQYAGTGPHWEVREPQRRQPPSPASASLQLELNLPEEGLLTGSWALLRGTLYNGGPGLARRIRLVLADDRWELRPPEVLTLSSGEAVPVSLNLLPLSAGDMSLDLNLCYELSDGSARRKHHARLLRVGTPDGTRSQGGGTGQVITIGGDGVVISHQGTPAAKPAVSARAGDDKTAVGEPPQEPCPHRRAHESPDYVFCPDCGQALSRGGER